MPNRGCNLECVKDREKRGGDDVLEFVGPVKIVLVEQSREDYLRRIWYAAAITLAQMALAVTSIILAFYSLSYKKKNFMKGFHILLGTFGLQSTLLSGVLSLNKYSGGAAPMKLADRKFEHVVLQTFSVGCAVLSFLVSIFAGFSPMVTFHSFMGLLAVAAVTLGGASGLYIYEFCGETLSPETLGTIGKFIYTVHRSLGVLAACLSAACFLTGMSKSCFKEWLPIKDMSNFMALFCLFYTSVIMYKTIKNFLD